MDRLDTEVIHITAAVNKTMKEKYCENVHEGNQAKFLFNIFMDTVNEYSHVR